MKNLRELREERKLTQAELAKRTGINPVTVNNVENGKTQPHAKVKRAIEKALGKRINWLDLRNNVENTKDDTNVAEAWEDVESNLRKVIISAKGLSQREKEQFVAVGRDYIKQFEFFIHAKDDEEVFQLDSDR